jgi:response regulator RpfG family c-di-GMP phosphodiesterase
MTKKILFVDDEQNILDGIKRQMRKNFLVDVAAGPKQGLSAIENHGPYAVIVSDLRMPVMDGIEFLSRVRETAPDTVRMMLSGNADLKDAIKAVNEGNVFQFLAKPTTPDMLTKALNAGLKHYQLIISEKELLEKTLKGSIKVLTELLALLNPEAFGLSSRIQRTAVKVASLLGILDVWEIETAAMLSHIGCVILPDHTIMKKYHGKQLTDEEARLFNQHRMVAADLLSNIPRIEKVVKIITYQEKHFDGSGLPEDSLRGNAIPLGARILKVILDFDTLESQGVLPGNALKQLKKKSGSWYDPSVIVALEVNLGIEAKNEVRKIGVSELKPKMILGKDIITKNGQLVISRGQVVTHAMLTRLFNFSQNIQEPIFVIIPL